MMSNKVEIELSAPAGTKCLDYASSMCSADKKTYKCFRGAEDCQEQRLTYCCPPYEVFPTPIKGALEKVMIEPPVISTYVGALSIGLSALAYDNNNQPIWSGVSYEWGISSSGSIGNINPIYGNITNFMPLRAGTGDIFVTARYDGKSITSSVPVVVKSVTPTPTITVQPNFKTGWNRIVRPGYREGELPLNCSGYVFKTKQEWWRSWVRDYKGPLNFWVGFPIYVLCK